MSAKTVSYNFTGRTLFLTGAGGGIPAAIAKLFAASGANLFLTDLHPESLTALAGELGDSTALATHPLDVSDPDAVAAAVAACRDWFGQVDYVVTGAGLYEQGTVDGMTDELWRRGVAVNLDGVFHTVRAALPHMPDGGAIVNIASMAGHRGSFGHAPYSAAKGAVLSLTRSLAQEVASRNIRCNAISPGLIDTPMVRGLMQERGGDMLKMTPLGRLGTPEEVAGVAAFLCSDSAAFLTAETIHVNGGLYIAS
ncbi:SDR family NAD(P)-dependent oxidoreductase [Nisaea nitritireducens]|uniref:SDR family NAD(P)-dependent oxidoreductase n=1 Tax=Nisaea nitritireducens TaxID=568392 RepID=UPI0018695934|nr:SDR family NAD(P)-dependent oxidoreductase [Nisaea nitritireducens]